MNYSKTDSINKSPERWYVILQKGEDIIAKLMEFAAKQDIKGASISGVGTCKDPELGYFDLEKKQYLEKTIKGDFEVLSLSGNISRLNGEPVIHIHTLISDENFKTFGGHLFKGETTGTAEIIIDSFGESIERKHSKENNLNLINL